MFSHRGFPQDSHMEIRVLTTYNIVALETMMEHPSKTLSIVS